jgi:hypothetical protein
MIKTNGFIADGLYSDDVAPRFWRSNNQYSARMIDLAIFTYLRREGLLVKDRAGRYLVSDKGRKFAKPWWQRWFALN